MIDTADESLAETTKAAGIILIGAILGMGLGFLSIYSFNSEARHPGPVRDIFAGFGSIYSLGLVLVGILVTVSSLGLNVCLLPISLR
ncbi:hypothetical protein AKJ47_01995 [candidate division MSBL1 archaeon SCGC-AAA261G05]|uniref:Uncharacterized protein n=1 Tax=candidate division MSBL1 archaeon SCGC-AAA261G05 TaxID=1698276 RepID=A0A133VAZ0_9EURY|nr:hypothetical protein AKJ47_01995 [candidate division MSBL1 archaeon SCGC-AAA261G05]